MSSWTGCRVAVLLLLVALIVGALGFATGFVTHAVVVAGTPEDMLLPGIGSSSGDLSVSDEEPAEDDTSDSSEAVPTEATELSDTDPGSNAGQDNSLEI